MTYHLASTLALLALAALTTANRRCITPAVPFARSLVGRTYAKPDDCYRPATFTDLRILRTLFSYTPLRVIRGAFICPERLVFHMRAPPLRPFIVRFPEIVDNDSSSTAEHVAFCQRVQLPRKRLYRPVGKTRPRFVKSVRRIVKGVRVIKGFECFTDSEGFVREKPGPNFENVELDGIVTYLLGVAFQFGFCVE